MGNFATPQHAEPSDATTLEEIQQLLRNDEKIKIAGIDCDGILRGKIVSKEKFLSAVNTGIAFCSTVFGWDMHDMIYTNGTKLVSRDSGFADFLAFPDLSTFRRIPWEDDIPFFLMSFITDQKPVSACGRGTLASLCKRIGSEGVHAMAGGKSPLTASSVAYD